MHWPPPTCLSAFNPREVDLPLKRHADMNPWAARENAKVENWFPESEWLRPMINPPEYQICSSRYHRTWRLSCSCGSSRLRFRHHVRYPARNWKTHVCPWFLTCSRCSTTGLLFDSNRHGYHARFLGSRNYPAPVGPAETYGCYVCGAVDFGLAAQLVYRDQFFQANHPRADDTTGCGVAGHELFSAISVLGECAECSTLNMPGDLACG